MSANGMKEPKRPASPMSSYPVPEDGKQRALRRTFDFSDQSRSLNSPLRNRNSNVRSSLTLSNVSNRSGSPRGDSPPKKGAGNGSLRPPSPSFRNSLTLERENSDDTSPIDIQNLSLSSTSSMRNSIGTGPRGKGRDKAAVAVCVRVRPLDVVGGEKNRDESNPSHMCWRYDSRSIAPQLGTPAGDIYEGSTFTFDNIFPPMITTDQIYKQVLSEIVQSTVEGYNGCIFAYGQTSSGKTFTMSGARSSPGVIPLATQEVFSHVKSYPDREFFFRLSYIEIYNEVVIDLLDPTKTGLQIRSSDGSSVVKILGVTEKVVTSAAEVMTTVTMGETHRSVGSTDMNEKSSRSHTIFRLVIESKLKEVHSASGPEYRVSSLNLVDLAGSESASKSGGVGQRRTEGSYINKSLLTLATVIQRLITASGHIPYRDSKLTRILEPALGGNSRTAIICTITPAAQHFSESMNTLKFAARAKRMKNKPILNDVNVSGSLSAEDLPLLKKYRDEIENLRGEKERLEQLNMQQQEELEHEKGQVEEMRTVLLQKIERYESMIVDLDSVSRSAVNNKTPIRYKTKRRDASSDTKLSAHGIEDARKVFGKLKTHVTDLQDRLNCKLESINKQVTEANKESAEKEREVQEFCKAIEEGRTVADEGKHLMLLNQVLKAVKEELKIEDNIIGQLVADMKNDLQMLDDLQKDFNSLETSLRSRDLKEKGLNNILKDLHNQVSDHKKVINVLSLENQQLHQTLNHKVDEGDVKLLEDQLMDLVEELNKKDGQLAAERKTSARLLEERHELENRILRLEEDKLTLEDLIDGTPSPTSSRGLYGKPGVQSTESVEELREINANLREDLQRMKQENNTQRLQMQRMQSELRKSQGSGGGSSAELNSLRQSMSKQSSMMVMKEREVENQRKTILELEQQCMLSEKCMGELNETAMAQREALSDLQNQIAEKETQNDMLLDIIENTETASKDVLVEMCSRLRSLAEGSRRERDKSSQRLQERLDMAAKHREEALELRSRLLSSKEYRALEGAGVINGDRHDDEELVHPGSASQELNELREKLAKEETHKSRLAEEAHKKGTVIQELERKVEYLMKQIKSLVQPAYTGGDNEEMAIQTAADSKFEEYLDVPPLERDDFVGDLIYQYEEQRVLLQRRFMQQLKEQV